MKIRGLILGEGVGSIVRDGRTLREMEKCGHFVLVSKWHSYVNEGDKPRSFTWHGTRYRIEYFDGSIYPFVVKQGDLQ